jgi:hypothetical protein
VAGDHGAHLLDDGTWLLVKGFASSGGSEPWSPAPGTLGVGDFLAAAVAGGVVGNLTYEMLKHLAVQAAEKTGLISSLSADDIANTVVLFLLANGYTKARVSELAELRDRGWSISGVVDGLEFSARADRSGRVIHLSVTD